MKHQCEATIWNDFHDYRCPYNGKVERDGKWYCGTHDPVAKAARDKAREEKWKKKWAEEAKERRLLEAAHALLAALEELTAAVETDSGGPGTDIFEDSASIGMYGDGTALALTFGHIRKARAAIAKARGE